MGVMNIFRPKRENCSKSPQLIIFCMYDVYSKFISEISTKIGYWSFWKIVISFFWQTIVFTYIARKLILCKCFQKILPILILKVRWCKMFKRDFLEIFSMNVSRKRFYVLSFNCLLSKFWKFSIYMMSQINLFLGVMNIFRQEKEKLFQFSELIIFFISEISTKIDYWWFWKIIICLEINFLKMLLKCTLLIS